MYKLYNTYPWKWNTLKNTGALANREKKQIFTLVLLSLDTKKYKGE